MSSLYIVSAQHGQSAGSPRKCRAVPAFVNQIPTTHWIDVHRQYLVTFITEPHLQPLSDLEPMWPSVECGHGAAILAQLVREGC